MRFVGLIVGLIPLAAACALTVSYDGYDKGSSSPDASSGQGGSTGIGGGTFGGGTSGVDGSLGGTAGSTGNGGTGGAPCNGDGECPADEPCVDWSCVGNQCVDQKLSGNPCAPNVCGDPTKVTISTCVLGICQKSEIPCAPYTCQGSDCLMSCNEINDCVGGLICNNTQCQQCLKCSEKYASPSNTLAFCPISQGNWDGLVSCCTSNCSVECSVAAVCGGLGTAGSGCETCLTQSSTCDLALATCLSDT